MSKCNASLIWLYFVNDCFAFKLNPKMLLRIIAEKSMSAFMVATFFAIRVELGFSIKCQLFAKTLSVLSSILILDLKS